jgi:hypothetical protein
MQNRLREIADLDAQIAQLQNEQRQHDAKHHSGDVPALGMSNTQTGALSLTHTHTLSLSLSHTLLFSLSLSLSLFLIMITSFTLL